MSHRHSILNHHNVHFVVISIYLRIDFELILTSSGVDSAYTKASDAIMKMCYSQSAQMNSVEKECPIIGIPL